MKTFKNGIFRLTIFASLVFAFILASCTGVPISELNAARHSLKDAMLAGAPMCATNEFSNAEEAFLKANNETAFRNYEQAKVDAVNAAELAKLAKRIADGNPTCQVSYQEAISGQEPAVAEPTPEPVEEIVAEEATDESVTETESILLSADTLDNVYFKYDDYVLTDQGRTSLDKNANFLLQNPNVKIIVEGHCDKRGSNEYNLALGLKRAKAIETYLVNSGVEASQVKIISYGEERPAVYGNNESAYSKNRRAEFKENYSS